MAHEDKIKDTDAFFVVDAITRQIKNMTPQKIVLVQGDHNSEKFTFSLPRYIEGHDMAESANANLHYINASKNVKGMYVMTDLKVDPENEENVICSWLISGNVTKEAGKLSFLIEFECYDGNVLVYSWHSLPYEGISVGGSFDNAEEIAEMYADVLQQWHDELFGANSGCGTQTDYNQNDHTQPDFLKNRPFYKEKILLTEGQVVVNYEGDDEFRWVEGAYMPAGELPNIEVDGHVKLLVEVNDNGEISTQTGYFDGSYIMDGNANTLEICDGKLYIELVDDNNLIFYCGEEIGDVTIKISMENIKQMDKEFLPSDISVPYFENDGSLLNTPDPSELPPGPCIIYGMIGKAANIHYFEDRPTLCNVIQRDDGLTVIHWFEEDEDYFGGMLARYLVTTDDEVIEDRSISLTDLDEVKSATYELACDASTEAVEAKEMAAAAAESADGAADVAAALSEEISATYSLAEEAYTAAMDEWVVRRFIMMDGPDGNVYQVRIDENGNLTAKIFE